MFLSTRGGSVYEERCGSQMETVASGGREPWVNSCGEMRRAELICPGGFRWRPAAGQCVLVIKTGSLGEDPCIIGMEDIGGEELAAGEVQLYSGGSSITLKNDGRILLEGTVYVNGEVLGSAT